jgi:hypothetical protein
MTQAIKSRIKALENRTDGKLIETKNVSLDTLSVTIKALHVNGKQMTLAVFRQLPEGEIGLTTGEKNTDFQWWGLVRYKINDCMLWVVAERDQRLYRLAANPTPWSYIESNRRTVSSCEAKLLLAKENARYYGEDIPILVKEKIDEMVTNLAEAKDDLEGSILFENKRTAVINEFLQLPQLFIAL